MKSPGAVIAEGLITCIRVKDQEEIRALLGRLHNKCIQLNFPNLHEAVVIFFDKNVADVEGIHYETYSTPIYHCKKCGWTGPVSELPILETMVKINELADIQWEASALMNPHKRRRIEKCPRCESTRLRKEEYHHKGRDLCIIGAHNDIAQLGTIMDTVLPRRLDGLIGA
ncbi:MAG: hypothetical protein LUQ65_06920, partial [Candidatus Helarchaeota archaeon]|nr:hypothetical protein [Candidatus Helarchaeota archaeon]